MLASNNNAADYQNVVEWGNQVHDATNRRTGRDDPTRNNEEQVNPKEVDMDGGYRPDEGIGGTNGGSATAQPPQSTTSCVGRRAVLTSLMIAVMAVMVLAATVATTLRVSGHTKSKDTALPLPLTVISDSFALEFTTPPPSSESTSENTPDDGIDDTDSHAPVVNEQVIELQNGIALHNQNGLQNEVQLYTMRVPPAHRVTCKTHGFKGDPDLYLRFNDIPEISFESDSNECVSAYDGTVENCRTGSSGDDEDSVLYVALHAHEAYRGITLFCTIYPFIEGESILTDLFFQGEIIDIQSGIPLDNQNGEKGEVQVYRISVPPREIAFCEIRGLKGDADLYLRLDEIPEIAFGSTNNECVSTGETSVEFCEAESNVDENVDLYVAVHAYEAYRGLTLSCIVEPATSKIIVKELIIELENNVILENQSGNQRELQLYLLLVPSDHQVACTTTGSNGDAELFLRFHDFPYTDFTSIFDIDTVCTSTNADSNEFCSTGSSGAFDTVLYVGLYAFSTYEQVSILCTAQPYNPTWSNVIIKEEIIELENDVILENQSGIERELQLYTLQVPAEHQVTCITTGSNGDADLVLRFHDFPYVAITSIFDIDADCISSTLDSKEVCLTSNSGESDAVLYVGLYAFSTYEQLSILCMAQPNDPTWSNIIIKEEIIELENDVILENQSGIERELQLYTLQVPAEHQVTCITTGSNGDADLFLRFHDFPYTDITSVYDIDADCISSNLNSMEVCVTDTSGESDTVLYVGLHAFSTYEQVSILCTAQPHDRTSSNIIIKEEIIDLESDVVLENQSGGGRELQLYKLQVPAEHQVRCTTAGAVGDVDLFLRFHDFPYHEVETVFDIDTDCLSASADSNEVCLTGSAGEYNTVLYVGLFAYFAYEHVSMICRVRPYSDDSEVWEKVRSEEEPVFNEMILELESGTQWDGEGGEQNTVQIFTLTVPPMSHALCYSNASNGDADLYLRFGEIPEINWSSSGNDCSSFSDFSDEFCIVSWSEDEGTVLYVAMHAYQEFSTFSLYCVTEDIRDVSPVINDEILPLENEVELTGQQGLANELQLYIFEVPPTQQSLVTCKTYGDFGTLDLFVRWNMAPDLTVGEYACSSEGYYGAFKICTVDALTDEDSILYVALYAVEDYYDVSIVCLMEG